MRAPMLVALATIFGATACYRQYDPAPLPAYQPQPLEMQGPPGGAMDPEYAAGYDDAYGAPGTYEGAAEPAAGYGVEPSSDPQDPGYVMGAVTDAEIDATLQPYGEWIEDPSYGRIWRPYTTVVGVDFTPYETCGAWVWTDYGWTFTCDWQWGWLPFHYGQWGWFDDYWAWVPDYTWSPAWVEWRHGGGYVGWRPMGPRIRDHRHGSRDSRPRIRDHRGYTRDSDWRFVPERDLGRGIRPLRNFHQGLRVTSTVARPPVRATVPPIRAANVMRDRLGVRHGIERPRPQGTPSRGAGDVRPRTPTWRGQPPYRPAVRDSVRPTYDRPARPGYDRPSTPPQRPTYDRPTPQRPVYDRPSTPPQRPSYDRPAPQRPVYDRPSTPPQRPVYDRPPPQRPVHDRPSTPPQRPSYDRPPPPQRPSFDRPAPQRPSYDRPAPQRPSYAPPSRPSYDRPSPPPRTFERPSPPSRPSYTPPSRPSPSSSNNSSRSYDRPSPSSSSSSRSDSSSSSSRGSSSSSGGGSRRR